MKIELAKTEVIHFVGIGGIGMSGLSMIMKGKGFKVQGSDICLNKNIERLKKEKIKVLIGHKKQNLKKATVGVISSAIKKNNPEVVEARRKNLPVISRGKMLAHIVSLMKNIVVVGSHGKTTTTSLVASIFQKTKLDPTIINGGVINSIKNTAKLGKSDWSILEADESDGSFIHIPPTYSIITNIDREHMDYYKSMDDLKNYFVQFIEKVPSFGKSFICIDDKINNEIIKKLKSQNFYTYGVKSTSNFLIKNIKQNKNFTEFDLLVNVPNKKRLSIKKIKTPLLGIHNVRNSVAAISVALTIGISIKDIKKGLFNFKGVQRRFNKIFTYNGIDFYDDYAHHPTEISSILEGVHNVSPKRKIISVFEPHRFSRVMSLEKEFSKCFSKSNLVIMCPLYAAGETKDYKFNLIKFASLIAKNSKTQVIIVKNEIELSNYFKKNLISNEIIIGMGAGIISKWMRGIKNTL